VTKQSKIMKTKTFILILTICFSAGLSNAEGLQTLIETGKSMGEIQKALDEETERYVQVKQAIDSGMLKKGASKDEVVAQYGEPIVASIDTITKRAKLVYMPASSSFFKGAKIYLYFKGDLLDEIVSIQ